MVDVARIRLRGGFSGLADEELAALIGEAAALVREDLDFLRLDLTDAEIEELVVLRTCALAAKRERTPVSESIGGASVTYERLSWDIEYARALARHARGRVDYGGNL